MNKQLQGLGLCFDLDGTLYAVQRWRVAWRMRRRLKVVRALMAAREQMRREASSQDEQSFLAREAELVAERLGQTAAEVKSQLPEVKAALAKACTFRRAPFLGVIESLQWAHAEGASLAVLSDFDPTDKLRNLGLDTIPWSICLGADSCGALKPDPRGFGRVRDNLPGTVEQILHIGDRLDSDVQGAKAAGFVPILFEPQGNASAGQDDVKRLNTWDKIQLEAVIRSIKA